MPPGGLISQVGAGDYFEQYERGALAEARLLGVELDIHDDMDVALDLQSALNEGIDAIAVGHAKHEVGESVTALVEAGLPIIATDFDPGNPDIPQISQSDHQLARQVLEQLVADTGGSGDVIYVYVSGFAPLDRRDEVWQEIKEANPGLDEVAVVGTVNDSIAATVADEVRAALEANPDTVAVFAPFDEFAKGAVLAIEELDLTGQVRVYGADISTADIAIMTADDSPWVATSATDPSNVGRITVRAAYLAAIGEELPREIVVSPTLITQEDLVANKVTNMTELVDEIPGLTTNDIVPVPPS